MDFDPNKAGYSPPHLEPMQHCRYSPWLLPTRCRQRVAMPLRIIHQHGHNHAPRQRLREGQTRLIGRNLLFLDDHRQRPAFRHGAFREIIHHHRRRQARRARFCWCAQDRDWYG